MRNNFHYGFGTRLTAVALALLMMLSLGGFTLRSPEGGPEVFEESYGGTSAPEDTAPPEGGDDTAEAGDTTPSEGTPAPEGGDTAAPTETDSDTDTDTGEPEATSDPQDIPDQNTEATPAPEGDEPPQGDSGLAPIADDDPPILRFEVSLSGNVDWNSTSDQTINGTMTITNIGGPLKELSSGATIKIKGSGVALKPGTFGDPSVSSGVNAKKNGNSEIKIDPKTGALDYVLLDKNDSISFSFQYTVKKDQKSARTYNFAFAVEYSNCSGVTAPSGNIIFTDAKGAGVTPKAWRLGSDGNLTEEAATITYHANLPTGGIGISPDSYTVSENTLPQLSEAFSGLSSGKYEADGTTYYFIGWDHESSAAGYKEVDYPVEITETGWTSTVAGGTAAYADLYAIWTNKPGLFGYDLTGLAGAKVTGDNVVSAGGDKYIVYDEGHNNAGASAFTPAVPEYAGYSFVGWYDGTNKKMVSGNAAYAGDNGAVQYLSAVFGTVTGVKDNPQTEASSGDGASVRDTSVAMGVELVFADGAREAAAFLGSAGGTVSNVTYKYQVMKKGESTPVQEDDFGRKVSDGDYFTGEMPHFSKPGVYNFTVVAALGETGFTVTKTATLTIGALTVTYHLNDPTKGTITPGDPKEDIVDKQEDGTPAAGGDGGYTFKIKQISALASKAAEYTNLEYGGLGSYSFLGWSSTKPRGDVPTSLTIRDVDFVAGVFEKDSSGKHTYRKIYEEAELTTKTNVDLYAVWSEDPTILGYTMTVPDAYFGDTSGLLLSGYTQNGANKYAVVDRTYHYEYGENEKDKDTLITVTSRKPAYSGKEEYQFICWLNKRYARAAGKDSYNPNNTNNPFLWDGDTFCIGNTDTQFSLDAVWARLEGNQVEVAFDNEPHKPENAELAIYGGGDPSLLSALKDEGQDSKPADVMDVTYSVTKVTRTDASGVSKDLAVDSRYQDQILTGFTQNDNEIHQDAKLALPEYTEVGRYVYTLSITFTDKTGMQGVAQTGKSTTIEAEAMLIIDPVLDIQVTKTVAGENTWDGGESFSFTLTPDGSAPEPAGDKTLTLSSGTNTAHFGQINYIDGDKVKAGTYTYIVSEGELASTSGLNKAADQVVTVVVTDPADDMPYTIQASAGGAPAPLTGNVYTLPLTFNNTYKGGSLTVKKAVEGYSKPGETFDIQVELKDKDNNPLKDQADSLDDVNETSEGIYTFKLEDGESVTFNGLPAGTKYTVSETPGGNYTANNPDGTGEIKANEASSVTVTNTRKTADLKVTKEVNGYAPSDKPFFFTVTLSEGGENIDFDSGDGFKDGVASFSLVAGETKTFADLPVGVTYTVKETADSQYTSDNGEQTGTIKETGNEITVTNTRPTASLTVNKTAKGADGKPETTGSFCFTLKLTEGMSDKPVTGEFEGNTFDSNGACTFTLGKESGTWTKTFTGLPKGVHYAVTEEADPNYTSTDHDTAIGVLDGNKVVNIDNTRLSGSLTVSKTVSGAPADTDRSFSFTLKLTDDKDDSPVTGTFGGVAFEADGFTFELKDKGERTFSGLPSGVKYTVTENDPGTEYTPSSEGASGEIKAGETAKASFTNTYNSVSLKLHKIVAAGGSNESEFTFRLTLRSMGADHTTEPYSLTGDLGMTVDTGTRLGEFTSGKLTFKQDAYGARAEFTVKVAPLTPTAPDYNVGEAVVTISGLPAGAVVAIKELNANGYEASFDGANKQEDDNLATVTLPASGTKEVTVTVTNKYKGGDLTVKKTVVNDAGTGTSPSSDDEFTFRVTTDSTVNGPRGAQYVVAESGHAVGEYIVFKEGVAEFKLKDGDSVKFLSLPLGAKYTVEEIGAPSQYAVAAPSNATGEIAAGETKVEFTNHYRPGTLTISKTVPGSPKWITDDPDYTFNVTIEGHDGDCPYKHGISDLNNDGEGTFTLKAGKDITLTDLPMGHKVTVTETAVPGAETTYVVDRNSADVKNGPTAEYQFTTEGTTAGQIAFTNRYKTGDLTVTKKIDGGPDNAKFDFTLTLTGTSEGGVTPDKINGQYGGVTFTRGTATFQLGENQPVRITGLPAGLGYTLEETGLNGNADGLAAYATTINGEAAPDRKTTGTIEDNVIEDITFTNRYMTGGLTVKKVVAGGGSQETDFSFTVQREGGKTVGTYGMTFGADGVAKFSLKHDGSVTASGLPIGTYVVKETAADGYTATYEVSSGASGALTADGVEVQVTDGKTASVTVTNTYKGGSLAISKTVTGDGADPNEVFTFTVAMTGYISGPRPCTITGEPAGLVTFENNQTTVKLKAGQTATIESLPADGEFTITEGTIAGYVPDERQKTATIVKDDTVTVSFENTYTTGSLVVTKNLTGDGAKDTDEFTFSVQLSDKTCQHTHGDLKFTDGYAEFTLIGKTGENEKTISGLPVGVGYQVEEIDSAGYTIVGAGKIDGVIAAGKNAVTFTNNKELDKSTLTVENHSTIDDQPSPDKFTYEVTLTPPGTAGIALAATYSDTYAAGEKYTFELTNGEDWTLSGVPVGTEYTVTQTAPDEYNTIIEVDETPGTEVDKATVTEVNDSIKDGGSKVVFTNIKTTPPGPGTDPNGPGDGGGTVDPPWTDPDPDPTAAPSATPGPSASPAPTLEPGTTSEPFGTPVPTLQPGTTSQPFGTPQPGGNNGGTGNVGPTSPVTGDETAIVPWAAMLGLSLMGLAAVLVRRKRRQRS